jgi:glycosyltransferase involved in cell wall biosynthesis
VLHGTIQKMSSCAVLHITSLLGGGVDRHVRDIARAAPARHLTWHSCDTADVIEIPGSGEFLPLDPAALERDPAALAAWLRFHRVGVIHAHSVDRAVRRRASWAAQALGIAFVVTLHDILFLRREGFEPGAPRDADPAWLAETAPFLRAAAAVIAPSRFVADLAREHVAGLEVALIPNGSPPHRAERTLEARDEFAQRRPRHVAAVLGAIGPHKGSAVVDELGLALEHSGIAIVVIGYLDMQVVPGWRGDHVFVHGPYDDRDVAALLAAYRAELALFPNRVPESFSYSLSDAWDAGMPALVPPEGALAERVTRHDGGWLLPTGFDAAAIAAALRRFLSAEGAGELARVKSRLALADRERVPALDDMTRSLDALYARFAIDPAAPLDPQSPAVRDLLAKNLDGALFRQELVRLADEMAQMKAALEATLEFERRQAGDFKAEARKWMDKLEGDVASLNAQVALEVEARRALGHEVEQLRLSKEAFDLLPALVRRLLVKKIVNARS